uniref:Integrase catalytic domain-containing protein n=1 Tax=Tanacetum cinerariifolium TaxID=118510 RepID=A0A699J2Z8_TANCI|nr:hypothetical protein [Tanacetum cinerariifolium]
MFDTIHDLCVHDYLNDIEARVKSKYVKSKSAKSNKKKVWKRSGNVITNIRYRWIPTGRTFSIDGNKFPLIRITSTTVVPPKKPIPTQVIKATSPSSNKSRKLKDIANVGSSSKFKTIGNVTIYRVYYVEGLGYNLFSVGQFYDSDLEATFQKHTCYVRNLDDVDLLSGLRDINLYTISLDDMLKSSPIYLLSKSSNNKRWFWHRRLSHLNFITLNKLAKRGLVRGLSKLIFEKDHLCLACFPRKSKKHSHKPKAEDTNQEKLYILRMDLYGLMRMESINGKKYIFVIVDDYSRFTLVLFLRSKDETLEVIIKQVRLNATVRNFQIDNGTDFVNQTLKYYHENVRITHQTSIVCTLQQNNIVKRHNQTLVEAAHTIEGEDLVKLKPEVDISIFVGNAAIKKAYRINKKQA